MSALLAICLQTAAGVFLTLERSKEPGRREPQMNTDGHR
jgi:hypothetical protein